MWTPHHIHYHQISQLNPPPPQSHHQNLCQTLPNEGAFSGILIIRIVRNPNIAPESVRGLPWCLLKADGGGVFRVGFFFELNRGGRFPPAILAPGLIAPAWTF